MKLCTFLFMGIYVMLGSISVFAEASTLITRENYPGKIDTKNVNGLIENIGYDGFLGALNITYPLSFPNGPRNLGPKLELSYSSHNTDAFSPYGYGFSLSLPRIQRSVKKGISELYTSDTFSAFGYELLPQGNNVYISESTQDQNRYTYTGGYWIVLSPDGLQYVYGKSRESRLQDRQSNDKVFSWNIEEVTDQFGHSLLYKYFIDAGQSYLDSILYGYNSLTKSPLYVIDFEYRDKSASLTSHRTQFEITTSKLLQKISLFTANKFTKGYNITYDTTLETISHLTSIEEFSGEKTLPKMEFSYGEGVYRHMITHLKNHKGAEIDFEYSPSTLYKSGELLSNNKLPFIVYTLSKKQILDTITGWKKVETYTYSGGHYYYDSNDILGREYAGFSQVSIGDEVTRKEIFYYQSHTADSHVLKGEDNISKKGLPYLESIYDVKSGNMLSYEYTKYDMRQESNGQKNVYLSRKIQTIFDNLGKAVSIGIDYEVDGYGNILHEKNMGWGNFDLKSGEWSDISGDTTTIKRTFLQLESPVYIGGLLLSEQVFDNDGKIVSSKKWGYDTGTGRTQGLVTSVSEEDVLGSGSLTISYNYTDSGLLKRETNPENKSVNYEYDAYDIALIASYNELGWKTSFEYDYQNGKQTSIVDPNGRGEKTIYDEFGREIQRYIGKNADYHLISETSYQDQSIPNRRETKLYTTKDQKNKKTIVQFLDSSARTIGTMTSLGDDAMWSSELILYGNLGQIIYKSYPFYSTGGLDLRYYEDDGMTKKKSLSRISGIFLDYDSIGRIIRQSDDRGNRTYLYEGHGVTEINELGYKTSSKYDAYGKLYEFGEFIDGRWLTTRYTYNSLGKMIHFIDALGNIRDWRYDGYGRLIYVSDLHMPGDNEFSIREYEYDKMGRIIQEKRGGNILFYEYDELSRIKKESNQNNQDKRIYEYDQGGNLSKLSSVKDKNSEIYYEYDEYGYKNTEKRSIGDQEYITKYTYDLVGNIHTIVHPNGGQVSYKYQNGYIQSLLYRDPSGKEIPIVSEIQYYPNQSIKSLTFGNGLKKEIEKTADYNYRISRIQFYSDTNKATPIMDTSYNYDLLSQITHIDENGIDVIKKQTNYSYDELGRLIKANIAYDIHPEMNQEMSYQYDDIGNIRNTSRLGELEYGGVGYTNPHAVIQVGNNKRYSYDQEGNLINIRGDEQDLHLKYSPEGTLIQSERNGETTDYIYDHTKRRISKSTNQLLIHSVSSLYEREHFYANVFSQDAAMGEILNVVSGEEKILDRDQTDANLSGTSLDTKDVIRDMTYIFLFGERIATIISQSSNAKEQTDMIGPIYHLSDHLGSSNLDITSTGMILDFHEYDPFGQGIYTQSGELSSSGGSEYKNKYLFIGKEYDKETDLHYFEKRYYDSSIGRFISLDPVFWEVSLTHRPKQYMTDPQQWNSYSYARNNPVNYRDSTGEQLKATKENLQDKNWLMQNDATEAYITYIQDVVDTMKVGDTILSYYYVMKNNAYGDLKSKKGNALGGQYAFNIGEVTGIEEDKGRFGVIIHNEIYTLDELGNFLIGYGASEMDIKESVMKNFSMLYQIKTSIGGDLEASIKDEKIKDQPTYSQGYNFAKNKEPKKEIHTYLSKIKRDY